VAAQSEDVCKRLGTDVRNYLNLASRAAHPLLQNRLALVDAHLQSLARRAAHKGVLDALPHELRGVEGDRLYIHALECIVLKGRVRRGAQPNHAEWRRGHFFGL
jgi:hypothetical protein